MDLTPSWFWTATIVVVVAVIVIGALIARSRERSKMTDLEKRHNWLDDDRDY